MTAPGARAAALAAGNKTYLSDKPCKNGHLAERYTSSRACLECEPLKRQNMTPEQIARKQAWWRENYHSNPEPFRERSKEYKRKLRAENPEKVREAVNAWERANRDKRRVISKRTREKNAESIRLSKAEAYRRSDRLINNEKSKAWRKKNPAKVRVIMNTNLAHRRQAVPKWLTPEQRAQIKRFYWLAQDCSIVTGEAYWVDHIIPLRGKTVCGLHVPWNLQVLPREVNQRKSNRVE